MAPGSFEPKDMNRKTDSGITRRRCVRDVGLGVLSAGLGATSLAATETVHHRLELRTKNLSATIVDNHDGLSGQQQIDRRARMTRVAEENEMLFSTVPFQKRFNGYNGVADLRCGKSHRPFCPCLSGQNCEFFFDNLRTSYEPRWSNAKEYQAQASSLRQLSDSSARLVVEPGRSWGVRVESQFTLVEP
jgi:hypothetical protein